MSNFVTCWISVCRKRF